MLSKIGRNLCSFISNRNTMSKTRLVIVILSVVFAIYTMMKKSLSKIIIPKKSEELKDLSLVKNECMEHPKIEELKDLSLVKSKELKDLSLAKDEYIEYSKIEELKDLSLVKNEPIEYSKSEELKDLSPVNSETEELKDLSLAKDECIEHCESKSFEKTDEDCSSSDGRDQLLYSKIDNYYDKIQNASSISNNFKVVATLDNRFPYEDDGFIKAMMLVMDSENAISNFDREVLGIELSKNRLKSDDLDSFIVDRDGNSFEMFYANNLISKKIISHEIGDSLAVEEFVHSLDNIGNISKMLLENDVSGTQYKSILVRRSPDMEASNKIKFGGFLKKGKCCDIAARNLVKLSQKFIFEVPDRYVRDLEILTIFRSVRRIFDEEGTVDSHGAGFYADKLLGPESFTFSLNDKKEVEVDVMLASEDVESILERDRDSLLCNTSIVLTIFPYNDEAIIEEIEASGLVLSDEDR